MYSNYTDIIIKNNYTDNWRLLLLKLNHILKQNFMFESPRHNVFILEVYNHLSWI